MACSGKVTLLSVLQSIIEKKTNIRRQRREIFLQDQQQKMPVQGGDAGRQQDGDTQPLKQVENNYRHTTVGVSQSTYRHSNNGSPIKSPVTKSEGATVAFGRTTKLQPQRSPSAVKGPIRRYSLENDSVSGILVHMPNVCCT